MSETIAEIEQEVIEEFEVFDDWMEKYEHIIELGKELPIIESQYKTEDNLIKDVNQECGYGVR